MTLKKRGFILFIFIFCLLLLFSLNFIISKDTSGLGKFNSAENHAQILKSFENRTYVYELSNQSNFIGLKIIDNQTWARIGVVLKDNSGIEIIGSKEEKTELVNQRIEWFKEQTEKFLEEFNDSRYIINLRKNSGGFSGLVSEEGLEFLLDKPEIDYINWEQYKPKLLLEGSAELINANDTWDLGYTGDGINICVIDSGIDKDHLDLPEVNDEYCYCYNNCCPGGLSGTNNATDEDGHGTRVAGVIASQHPIDRGIAYNSSLYIVRVTDEEGEFSNDPYGDVRDAIDWCRNQGVDVISMSFRFGPYSSADCPSTINTEISNAYNSDIVLISASGNDAEENKVGYPACNYQVISVGGSYDAGDESQEIDWCDEIWGGYLFLGSCWFGEEFYTNEFSCKDFPGVDQLACWSNRNSELDLLAPGFEVTTTALEGGFTSSFVGTSLSAPMVSGAAALLIQANSSLKPNDIKELLQDTGVDVYDSETGLTFKRIDIEAALDEMCDKDNDGHYNEACSGGNDCNDNHGGIYSGATEYCDGVDNDCDDLIDEGCQGTEPEGESYTCTEAGYEQCAGYSYGDCNVAIAINHYANISNIKWGQVNDSSDPYVVGNYTFGWKVVNGGDIYYDVDNPGTSGEDDCNYEDACAGDKMSDTGTRSTVFAPGIAFRKNILGYDNSGSYACWTWFNSFSPNYGVNNPIYVLNCYNNSDCSSGYFCDKSGNWADWGCVAKKGSGQNCSSNSECSSGYCDNDGVGLSDDGICFTPYNSYFDGQERRYCEYSTGYGDINCDEKEIGNGCGTDCEWSINNPNISLIIHPNGNKTFENTAPITINWTSSSDLNKDFVRYFLQYSNNSGVNWTDIISNYGYENRINDSLTSKQITFNGKENKTIYIRLPKKANITYAQLDLTGVSG